MYTKISMRFVNMNYQHCFPFLGINSCKIFYFSQRKKSTLEVLFFFLRVNVSFYFPKMPFCSQNCTFTPRIALLFSTIGLLFFRIALLFSKSALLLPGIIFVFQKCPFVFQSCLLVFQKCLCLYYCARLFPRMLLSPADCNFSSSWSELFKEIIFALLLFCFLFKLIIDKLQSLQVISFAAMSSSLIIPWKKYLEKLEKMHWTFCMHWQPFHGAIKSCW